MGAYRVSDSFQVDAPWLARVIRARFGAIVSADDLVQEAYLRFPPGEVRHPRAFLLRMASRLAIDQLRRQSRTQAYAEAQARARLAEGDVEAGDQHERLVLKQILEGLPTTCRETFILHRFGGFTYEEIAQRQGVSLKTVEWRISKALAYCADQLDV